MSDLEKVRTLLEGMTQALSSFDEEALLRLEAESERLSLTRLDGSSFDARRMEAAMRVMRLTLEATAVNLRLARRLCGGEEERWAH